MRSPIVDSPQIIDGRIQDVSYAIRGIGRFLNPTGPRWLFHKDGCIHIVDTIQKLTAMKIHLIKFYHTMLNDFSDRMLIEDYENLHFYIDAAIAYMKSKAYG